VVNFDSLVDRKLLQSAGIEVIHYTRDRDAQRNVVVSTTASGRLLETMLVHRLQMLNPSWTLEERTRIAKKFRRAATGISGQIVMRAARQGIFANELLGIVLSAELVREELGVPHDQIGWFFLDDYASWFGQTEERIADLMAIAPDVSEGFPVLKLVITEAKFVSAAGYTTHARKSAQQLRDTVLRLSRALDPEQRIGVSRE
jgi:hypothetical protein